MPVPDLDVLYAEVTELTRQPELAVVQRRAARRRRRHQALGGAAVGLAVAVVAGVAVAGAPSPRHGQPAAVPSRPAPGVAPSELVPFPSGPVAWADAADGSHVYAVLSECGACTPRLVGSDDGGRTWTVRDADANPIGHPVVRAAQTLSTFAKGEQVSVDGGRTWFTPAATATPAPSVPAGDWLACPRNATGGGDGCAPNVVDPASRTMRPLANRPQMRVYDVAAVPDGAGLWLTGTTTAGQPAVAVSRDAGRTWSVHQFQPPSTKIGSGLSVTTRDGTTVYAVARKEADSYGYRSTDGGRTWQPTNGGAVLPGPLNMDQPSVALADGRQVLQQNLDDMISAWVSADSGARYVGGQPAQWPITAVHLTPAGTLVGNTHRALYLSPDGIHWSSVTPR